MVIIGIVAAAVVLVLAILFYLANGARHPNARIDLPVEKNPHKADEGRSPGLN